MNDRQRVLAAPADRIAALFGHGFSPGLAADLAASARFETRFADAAVRRLGDLPPLAPDQSAALALAPDDLRDLVLRAGAVFHAAALARVIDGATRRNLTASLGSDVYVAALEGRGLAPPGAPADEPPDDLPAAVSSDGEACWAAWRERQPAPVGSRLVLFGPRAAPKAAHKTYGPSIVSWLLDRR